MFCSNNSFSTFNCVSNSVRIVIKLKEKFLFKFWAKESLANHSFLILRSFHICLNKRNQRKISNDETNFIRNNSKWSLSYSKFIFCFLFFFIEFLSLLFLSSQNQFYQEQLQVISILFQIYFLFPLLFHRVSLPSFFKLLKLILLAYFLFHKNELLSFWRFLFIKFLILH